MVLSALATYPEIWSAGVDIVGIANFVTFLERTGPWRRKVREDEYGSLANDREFLESISPLHHVQEIRTPLLVVHGANDPRVPIFEAEQIVAALTDSRIPFTEVAAHRASLEEAYMELTRDAVEFRATPASTKEAAR